MKDILSLPVEELIRRNNEHIITCEDEMTIEEIIEDDAESGYFDYYEDD